MLYIIRELGYTNPRNFSLSEKVEALCKEQARCCNKTFLISRPPLRRLVIQKEKNMTQPRSLVKKDFFYRALVQVYLKALCYGISKAEGNFTTYQGIRIWFKYK